MTMKKESSLHKKIKKYAEGRGWYVVKVWGGGFQEAGVPDLIMAVNGYFIGMEVKIGTGKPSPIQLDHLLSVNEAGAIGCLVWSFDEAKEIITYVEGLETNVVNKEYHEHISELYKNIP